jgi:hypothetical protein
MADHRDKQRRLTIDEVVECVQFDLDQVLTRKAVDYLPDDAPKAAWYLLVYKYWSAIAPGSDEPWRLRNILIRLAVTCIRWAAHIQP